MDGLRKVLLLIGSPRNSESTSASLGCYLCSRFGKEIEINTTYIFLALRRQGGLEELVAATDAADLIILAFPLYIDSLPAGVIRVLEAIAKHRLEQKLITSQRFVAICNCGFPESIHIEPAMLICRRFTAEAGLKWAGGLALGGGEAIHGQHLVDAGGRGRYAVQALDLAADALARGESVPREASKLMAKPIIPSWLYRLFGQYGWKKEAGKYGTLRELKARPYDHEVQTVETAHKH